MFHTDDDRPLKTRGGKLVPFTLSGISKQVLKAAIPTGIIYAALLVWPLVEVWRQGQSVKPVFLVAYLGLAAELLAFVPLAIVALRRNAEKDLAREVRLERMTGVARAILIGLAVFIASCAAAFVATRQVIILPGTAAFVVMAITWQDLRAWDRFRQRLMKQEAGQGQGQEPGQPPGLGERKPDPVDPRAGA